MSDSNVSPSNASAASDSESELIGKAPTKPWLALAAILVGMSMIIIDGSVVNVLLPTMVDDLGLTQTDAQWINSIYSLLFASLLITVGLLADKFGRRLLFLAGIIVFIVGSILAGMAGDPNVMIAARAVQAIGASMMLPSSIAVINTLFTGRDRAIAFGLWGAVFGGAAALGPLLGGWLAQDFSWRWAFYINVPVALIAFFMVLALLPESRVRNARGFDPVGVVLSAVGLGLIVYGLIEGQDYGWWTAITDFSLGPINLPAGGISVVPVSFAVGVILLLVLVGWERRLNRLGAASLIDLSLFKIRRYGFGNVVALVVSLGEFGILFAIPLWLQSVAGFDALTSGVLLASLALGTFFSGGMARRVSAHLGATQVVRMGMGLEIVGIVGIGLLISMNHSAWWLTVPLIVYGAGLGFASAQLTNVVLADVPSAKSGQASAVTSTFRQVGSALGAAILGAVLFSGLAADLNSKLKNEPGLTEQQRSQIVDSVRTSAGQSIVSIEQQPGLQAIATDAKEAYTDSAKWSAWVAAGFVFLGLLCSLALPRDEVLPATSEETEPVPS